MYTQLILNAIFETFLMVSMASLVTVILGLPLGILLAFGETLFSCKRITWLMAGISNIFRSIPFTILVIALLPLTRFIAGTTIGTAAAIVPLSIAAIPFMGRLVENVLLDLPKGLVETGHSMGATSKQIIYYIILPEALPGLINAFTVMTVTLLAYSAMAGALGAGGLGDVAVRYGYQRFNMTITYITVAILIILVQIIQYIGQRLANYFKH